MENTNADKGTREIVTNRWLELNNPDFNAKVMQAIVQERFVQLQRRRLLTWLLVILTIDVAIGLTVWTIEITLSDFASFPYALVSGAEQAIRWMIEYHYLILPLVAVMILKRIVESRIRYS